MADKDFELAPNQIWEHIVTGVQIIILDFKTVSGEQMAMCGIMANNKVGKERVLIPAKKIHFWGNRGFAYVTTRKGKTPKVGNVDDYGTYNLRAVNLGAM